MLRLLGIVLSISFFITYKHIYRELRSSITQLSKGLLTKVNFGKLGKN